jgi:hypothetical protein
LFVGRDRTDTRARQNYDRRIPRNVGRANRVYAEADPEEPKAVGADSER